MRNLTQHTIIFRIAGGDVYEVPTKGYKHYWQALRSVLNFFGLRLNQVVICK